VPVPDELLSALDNVHGVRRAQKRKQQGEGVMLSSWGRTEASKHIYAVMADAGVIGPNRRKYAVAINRWRRA